MAHQAHSIPWQTLADTLRYVHASTQHRGSTNLYLHARRPGQGKQLQYFTIGFCRALEAYSAVERSKYDIEIPDLDELIISDETMNKIQHTVRQYRDRPWEIRPLDRAPRELLPRLERTTRDFYTETNVCEGDFSESFADVCELTKTLILFDEMDTVLRIAAYPGVRFWKLWDEGQYCCDDGFGLAKLLHSALHAYICLNVLFLKPELYNTASREVFIKEESKARRKTYQPEQYDYRLTAAYQRMLVRCTGTPSGAGLHEVHTFPHRQFFGIPRGLFNLGPPTSYTRQSWWQQQRELMGVKSIADMAEGTFKGVYIPGKSDCGPVFSILRRKGLPTELIIQIMETAEYKPQGRTFVRDDPFHMDNAEEMKKYISFCWKILVRMDMLIKENKCAIDWEAEVTDVLYDMFDMHHPRVSDVVQVFQKDDEPFDITRRTRKRIFIT